MSKAITTMIKFTSRASVKVGDSYYTVEACEERMIPDLPLVDIEEERKDLWDTVNRECDNQIEDIINNPNLNITNIKLELLYETLTEEEYYDLFDDNMEIIYKKFDKACKKYNINYYKTNLILKNRLLNALNNDNLINLMKNERRLNIVLDNARIHTSKVVEMTCDMLNINLVFLPPYCPFLNPIENVWKDVKREIYNSFYTNLEELIEIFEDSFMARVYSETYYKNWLNKFFA